jgi:hypothetical protein
VRETKISGFATKTLIQINSRSPDAMQAVSVGEWDRGSEATGPNVSTTVQRDGRTAWPGLLAVTATVANACGGMTHHDNLC